MSDFQYDGHDAEYLVKPQILLHNTMRLMSVIVCVCRFDTIYRPQAMTYIQAFERHKQWLNMQADDRLHVVGIDDQMGMVQVYGEA